MRRNGAHLTSNTMEDFWRTYVHIGVLTYSLGALVVLAYALATPTTCTGWSSSSSAASASWRPSAPSGFSGCAWSPHDGRRSSSPHGRR